MNKLIHILVNTPVFPLLLFCSYLYCQDPQQVTAEYGGNFAVEVAQGTELSTCSFLNNWTLWPDSTEENAGVIPLSHAAKHAAVVLRDSSGAEAYQLPEVVVTSTRVPQTVRYTPSFITVVKKDEIDAQGETSLAQVLSPISGIFIKDYGAVSGLKTISERGMGAEHTQILLNGMRVSSMPNGVVDLGLLPVDEIGSIEVIRGGQSASYGADAVAGLVNVVTNPVDSRTTAEVSSSVGSFGYRKFLISGNLSSGCNGVRLSYGQEESRGNFPFKFHNGPVTWNLARGDADLLARYAHAQGLLMVGNRTQLAIVASEYSSERGVPGELVSPYSTSRARQIDEDHLVQTSLTSGLDESLTLTLSVQAHFCYEHYEDPDRNIGGTPLDTYFRVDDIRIVPRVELKMSDDARFSAGVELANMGGSGKSLDRGAVRRQFGTFIAGELTLLESPGLVNGLTVFPTLRLDAISSTAAVWSPQLGILMGLQPFSLGPFRGIEPEIRSSVSRNFRMPTFNELYFSGGGGFGNPALRPERSTSFDIGGSLHFAFMGDQLMQATFFSNDMTDRIVWTESVGGSVVSKNLRRVRSTGIEGFFRWGLPEKLLSFQVSYAKTNAKKVSADYPGDPTLNAQLPYVPHGTLSVSAYSTLKVDGPILQEIGASLSYSFVSYWFVTEDNAQYLPSYQTMNVGLRGKILVPFFSIVGRLEISNLFNEEYQVMLGYPMPQRSYRVTVAVEY